MKIEIVVPQIGEAVSELTLVSWLKNVGDSVQKGDVLFEIDSDKAIVEVEAFVDGKLIEITSPDGSAVMPQDVVAFIETETEQSTQYVESEETIPASSISEDANGRQASPVARRIAGELGVDLEQIDGTGPRGRITAGDVQQFITQQDQTTPANAAPVLGERINASPKAKRLAMQRNVDLRPLNGTGVGGMVRVKDVEAAAQSATSKPASGTQSLSKLRQTVATRTLQSKQEIPHFYLMVDVNMTQADALRTYCVASLGWDRAPTYSAILVRSCALAFKKLEWANRSYKDGGLIVRDPINIGVAVATSDGLMVPVIANADQLNLRDSANALRAAAQRAQEGRLKPSDMVEKSMTISNLGMYSVDQFIAIIDTPDPMILAVGRVADRVAAVDGRVAIQPMCTLTLSVDHRAFDGVQGAQFLEQIKDNLESPFAIIG